MGRCTRAGPSCYNGAHPRAAGPKYSYSVAWRPQRRSKEAAMTEVFEGLKVVDFTEGMLGAVTTMVLSDFGAEVVKVEPPGGHRSRSIPAATQWNRGKKSVVLDMEQPEGREKAQRLSLQSDVVIESFTPGATERMGIGLRYAQFAAPRPGLLLPDRLGSQGPLRPLQALRGRGGGQDRQDDGLLRAGQPAADRTTPPCRPQPTRPTWAPCAASSPRSTCATRPARARRWKPA